jgi:hypothetical protein
MIHDTNEIELWQKRMKDFETSDLTGTEWCLAQDIPLSRFRYWRRKLRLMRSLPNKNRWMTVDLENPTKQDPLFIHFGSAKIEVHAVFDPDLFARCRSGAACFMISESTIEIVYLAKGPTDLRKKSNGIPTAQMKSTLTNNVIIFLSQLRTKYHNLGIYSNQTYFNSYLDLSKIKNAQKGQPRFLIWLSRYRGESTYLGPGFSVDLWQFTSNGSVSGVSGAVDRNISYYNSTSY